MRCQRPANLERVALAEMPRAGSQARKWLSPVQVALVALELADGTRRARPSACGCPTPARCRRRKGREGCPRAVLRTASCSSASLDGARARCPGPSHSGSRRGAVPADGSWLPGGRRRSSLGLIQPCHLRASPPLWKPAKGRCWARPALPGEGHRALGKAVVPWGRPSCPGASSGEGCDAGWRCPSSPRVRMQGTAVTRVSNEAGLFEDSKGRRAPGTRGQPAPTLRTALWVESLLCTPWAPRDPRPTGQQPGLEDVGSGGKGTALSPSPHQARL